MALIVSGPLDMPLNSASSDTADQAMPMDPLVVQCSSEKSSPDDNPNETPDGFTLVKAKRKRKDSNSTTSDCTIITGQAPKHGLVVVLKPRDPTTLITKINPLKLREKLESVSSEGLIRVRPNPRLNLLALDTRNSAATKDFLGLTCIGKIAVQAYEPRPSDSSVGIIYGVSTEISDADLQTAFCATTPVQTVRRLGSSEIVKLVFSTETTPAHVLIGYTRFAVHPYVEKPLRCPKCFRLGHVADVCTKTPRCSRCGGDHESTNCPADHPRCINCKKHHASTSRNCPVYKREAAICHHKSEHRTNYWTARNAVLSRNDTTHSGELQKQLAPVLTQLGSSAPRDGLKGVVLPKDKSVAQVENTTDFPLLDHEPSPVKPQSASCQPPVQNCNAESTTSKPLLPQQRKSVPQAPSDSASSCRSSAPNLRTTICTILELICNLLSPLKSPIAQALKSLIDIAVPLVTSWCA